MSCSETMVLENLESFNYKGGAQRYGNKENYSIKIIELFTRVNICKKYKSIHNTSQMT